MGQAVWASLRSLLAGWAEAVEEGFRLVLWSFGGGLNLAAMPAAGERRVGDKAAVVAFKPPNGDLSRLMRFFLVEAENPLRPGG